MANSKHINIKFDEETFIKVKTKAVANQTDMTKVGRILFMAWLNDDPHIKAVMEDFAKPRTSKRTRSSGSG